MSPLEAVGIASESRCTRRRVQDLELRLGQSKSAILSCNKNPRQLVTIVVEDDDDEVRISSPRSVAQARSSACSRGYCPVHVPILDDEDLELRLGLAEAKAQATQSRDCQGTKAHLCHLYGYHERGNVHCLRSHLLQKMYHNSNESAEEMPNLSKETCKQSDSSHLHSWKHKLGVP